MGVIMVTTEGMNVAAMTTTVIKAVIAVDMTITMIIAVVVVVLAAAAELWGRDYGNDRRDERSGW